MAVPRMRSASLCQPIRQTTMYAISSGTPCDALVFRYGIADPGLRQRERPGILGNAVEEAVSIARVADLVSGGKQAHARVGDRVPRGVARAARSERLGVREPDERAAEHAAATHGRAARDGILGCGHGLGDAT